MKVASRPRAQALVLPVTLDMSNAQELKDRLMAALERTSMLRLNGSKTRQVATPGIQILLAASQSANSAGGRFILVSPSPALKTAFEALGLSHKLNDWRAADV